MPNTDIRLFSIVKRSAEHVSATLDGEVVILNIHNNTYYGIDGVGAFVWNSIEAPCRVDIIVDRMLESYDVSREACEADVVAFLSELSDAGLIRVVA
jgi:hypothetical protein